MAIAVDLDRAHVVAKGDDTVVAIAPAVVIAGDPAFAKIARNRAEIREAYVGVAPWKRRPP